MRLDIVAAGSAVGAVGRRMGLDLQAAAAGIFTVVNANMIDATRAVSVQKGFDPRDFALVAFGGCGPIHAAYVARELGVPRVVVPYLASLLSAYGMLLSDLRAERSRTVLTGLHAESMASVAERFAELADRARADLAAMNAPASAIRIRYEADMRYRGQAYEVQVPIDLDVLQASSWSSVRTAFEAEHRRAYGHSDPHEPVEWVNLRAVAMAPPVLAAPPAMRGEWAASARPEPERRAAFFPEYGAVAETPVWRGEELPGGFTLAGPALVEYDNHVAVVPAGMSALVDGHRSLVIEVAA
jgi:N-methylhydantoinase A